VLSFERIMESFRARSQLLAEVLEEEDDVLHRVSAKTIELVDDETQITKISNNNYEGSNEDEDESR
jgi:hypothetical protein